MLSTFRLSAPNKGILLRAPSTSLSHLETGSLKFIPSNFLTIHQPEIRNVLSNLGMVEKHANSSQAGLLVSFWFPLNKPAKRGSPKKARPNEPQDKKGKTTTKNMGDIGRKPNQEFTRPSWLSTATRSTTWYNRITRMFAPILATDLPEIIGERSEILEDRGGCSIYLPVTLPGKKLSLLGFSDVRESD